MNLVKHSAKVVITDDSAAFIVLIKEVMPMSFIQLDEWHLDQRQYVNVVSTLRRMGMPKRFCDLENELHLMRRSSSIVRFQIRRANFEKKWFENSMDCIHELFQRNRNCSLVPATVDEKFLSDALRTDNTVVETNNVQYNDADIPQDSMDHPYQLSWPDGDNKPNEESKEAIGTFGTITKDLWTRLPK